MAILVALGFDGKNGWGVARWIRRGFKSAPVAPMPVIIHATAPAIPPPIPRIGTINLPPGRPVIGREDDVARIKQMLSSSPGVALTNSGAVLKGQGGIGKSTLARHFAEVEGHSYHGALWTHAGTRQAVIDGLCALCVPLGLPVPDQPQQQHAQAVLAAVQAQGKPWLFIYDNVETRADIEGLIPQGAHLILTTRQGEGWPGFRTLPTEALGFDADDAPAVRLLMEVAGRTDDAPGARALAGDLGGLPLGLVVMGSLIRLHGGTWAENRTRLAEALTHVPENEGYPTSIMGAVKLSYDRLPPDAQMIADLCAWWASEGLGPWLLTEAVGGWLWQRFSNDISDEIRSLAQDPIHVRAGFAASAQSSLLTGEAGSYLMHRMTASALRAMQSARKEPLNTSAAAFLATVYPGGENSPGYSSQWPLCKRLTPHVLALLDTGQAPRNDAMGFLLNQSSIFLNKIGDHNGQIACARASLDIKRETLPPDHRDIAVGLANLGVALGKNGDLKAAEEMLAEAVTLNEANRPGSADLANKYDLHGSRLLDLAEGGDSASLVPALRRYQQALALRRRLFGRSSDPVAQALNNLATTRDLQGRSAAAARLYGASLEIWRKILPPEDAQLAYGAMNTGASLLESAAADKAEPLLKGALDIREAALADYPDHPERRNAAGWLILCLLVRARAGENRGLREAQAKELCKRYRLDFDERQEHSIRFPYTPDKTPT